MTTKKVFTLTQESVPWDKLNTWQKAYIEHTLKTVNAVKLYRTIFRVDLQDALEAVRKLQKEDK